MNMRNVICRAAMCALLAACSQAPQSAGEPAQIGDGTYCSLDGMRLLDYPDPKAQIVYAQGQPDFFCDTVEMFAIVLGPEQRRRPLALYVQDMTGADWQHPATGHWIDAHGAVYVSGSDQRGSMGATLVPFAHEDGARAFIARHGGKLLHFADVTPDMVALDGGVLHDATM